MSTQRMQLFLEGDAIGLQALKPGEKAPASTMDMRAPVSFASVISLSELFDPAERDWVLSQLMAVLLPEGAGTRAEALFQGTLPIRKAITAYQALQDEYREHPRPQAQAIAQAAQRYEESFRCLPFWMKVAAYGSIQAITVHAPGEERGTVADRVLPGRHLLRVEPGLLATPYALAGAIVAALDANVLFARGGFAGEAYGLERFSDLTYWKDAVRQDMRHSGANPFARTLITRYLARTRRKATSFHLPPTDRHFFAEALTDFVLMEMLLSEESGLREPEASAAARRGMAQAFEHMATVYYTYSYDRAHRPIVVRQFGHDAPQVGPDLRLRREPNAADASPEANYRILDTFREMCLWAAQDRKLHGDIPVTLIRTRDRKSPDYEPCRLMVAPAAIDFRKNKAKQVLGGYWGYESG
jgi:hypothetical protein